MFEYDKQPEVVVMNIHGDSFGIKKVTCLNWNSEGRLYSIYVDFVGGPSNAMYMFDPDGSGIYRDPIGNLNAQFHK